MKAIIVLYVSPSIAELFHLSEILSVLIKSDKDFLFKGDYGKGRESKSLQVTP